MRPAAICGLLVLATLLAATEAAREEPHRRELVTAGLAISASMTRMMNGTIDVHSNWGEGTTFTVTLPLAEPPATPPLATAAGWPPDEELVPETPDQSHQSHQSYQSRR